MNENMIVVYVSEAALFLFVVIALILLLLASVYDARAITRRKSFRAVVRRLRWPRQPSVTVLVYAHNSAHTIEACLKSIQKSRYRHFDVVVIDNGSTDQTKQNVKNYQKSDRQNHVVFYKKRTVTSRLIALQQGYRRSRRGDLVFVIDGNSVLLPSLLKESAAHFVAHKKLSALQLHRVYNEPPQFTTLTRQFIELSRVFYRKSTSLIHTAHVARGVAGTFYTAAVFKKGHRIAAVPCVYDYSLRVAVSDSPKASTTERSNVILRVCLAIFVIILSTYYLFIAARLESSSMLTLAWAAVSLWCLITVWSDETKTITGKLTLAFCVPIVYFLLYVQLIAWVFRFPSVK